MANGIIKSVQKSLKILKYIISSSNEVSISELVDEFGYSQSTVHHILKTLNIEGFISQNTETKKYNIGPELFNKWLDYKMGKNYYAKIYPIIENIVEEINETTNLFIMENNQGYCLLGKESTQLLRAYLMIGRRIPLHCTAAGKSFLAYMEEERVKKILEESGIKKYMENTKTNIQEIMNELKKVRKKGFATEEEEFEELINAISVPLFGANEKVVATISVVAPKTRLTPKRMQDLAPFLKDKSKKMSKILSSKKYIS